MTKQRKSKEFYQYIQEQMALEYGIDINKGVILQKEEESKLKRKISLPNLHQRKSIID